MQTKFIHTKNLGILTQATTSTDEFKPETCKGVLFLWGEFGGATLVPQMRIENGDWVPIVNNDGYDAPVAAYFEVPYCGFRVVAEDATASTNVKAAIRFYK